MLKTFNATALLRVSR